MIKDWLLVVMRWVGVRGKRSNVELSPAVVGEEVEDALPSLQERLIHAALRDAIVIHGASSNWLYAELIGLNSVDTNFDIKLIVSAHEMEVWGCAEEFQKTFWQQICVLGGSSFDWLPAITWKFVSQEVAALNISSKGFEGLKVFRGKQISSNEHTDESSSIRRKSLSANSKKHDNSGVKGELVV